MRSWIVIIALAGAVIYVMNTGKKPEKPTLPKPQSSSPVETTQASLTPTESILTPGSKPQRVPFDPKMIRVELLEISSSVLKVKVTANPSGDLPEFRSVLATDKTKFLERRLKPPVEIEKVMQKYAADKNKDPNTEFPFNQTYTSEREIGRSDLKTGDTLSVFGNRDIQDQSSFEAATIVRLLPSDL